MKLIVGLGNPGNEYANTRHNVGFMAVERIAKLNNFTGAKQKFHAGVIEGHISTHKVVLMQPLTFMNRSGLAVAEAARFYKLTPDDIMVIVDDTAIPTGDIRIRPTGTAGGHNGLSDIRRAIGTWDYPRLRIGIGKPEINGHTIPLSDYVLGRFSEEEMQKLDSTLTQTNKAVECWLDHDVRTAMNNYNTPRVNDKPVKQDKVSCDKTDKNSQDVNRQT